MATDEARGMRKRCRVFLRYPAVFLGVINKRVEVVTDNLGHTGRGHGDHLRLIQCLGIFQTSEHVLLAAEYCGIFRHGVGDTGDWLLEVTVEIGTEVGNATL